MSKASDLVELRRFAATVQDRTGIVVTVEDDFTIRGDRWSCSASTAQYVRAYLFGMLGAAKQLAKAAR